MDGPKRYDEKEVADILRRAAELERSRRGGAAGGLSRADLEKVAADAGLDPAAVRAAIAEREGEREAAPRRGLLGGPLRLRLDRELPGELDERGVERVLERAEHELGMRGRWYRSGSRWTWSPKGVARQLQVRVQVRDGRTDLTLDERFGGLAGGLWGGLFGGSIGGSLGVALPVGLAALQSGQAVVAIFGTLMTGAFFLTRAIYGAATRGRQDELGRLADQLVSEAARELELLAQEAPAERDGAGRPLHREPRRESRDADEDRRRRRRPERD